MSATMNMDIHDVREIVTQARCLNGQWQRRVVAICDDGSELTLTLYALGEPTITERPNEYVRVLIDNPAVVERSDKPFDSALSAQPRASQE